MRDATRNNFKAGLPWAPQRTSAGMGDDRQPTVSWPMSIYNGVVWTSPTNFQFGKGACSVLRENRDGINRPADPLARDVGHAAMRFRFQISVWGRKRSFETLTCPIPPRSSARKRVSRMRRQRSRQGSIRCGRAEKGDGGTIRLNPGLATTPAIRKAPSRTDSPAAHRSAPRHPRAMSSTQRVHHLGDRVWSGAGPYR